MTHSIVSKADWQIARDAFVKLEKAHTRAADALAAARRRLPWEKVEGDYRFLRDGRAFQLGDVFEGRRQLIIYHHMLIKDDPAPCAGCAMVGDQIPHLAHLHARNTTLAFVSRAPSDQIAAFRTRMGWQMPWYETADSFNADFGVTGGFGLNVFMREGKDVYRSYFTTNRGVETLGTMFTLLDLTPFGRQEEWQDAPAGTPQGKTYAWWRLHDEYDA